MIAIIYEEKLNRLKKEKYRRNFFFAFFFVLFICLHLWKNHRFFFCLFKNCTNLYSEHQKFIISTTATINKKKKKTGQTLFKRRPKKLFSITAKICSADKTEVKRWRRQIDGYFGIIYQSSNKLLSLFI